MSEDIYDLGEVHVADSSAHARAGRGTPLSKGATPAARLRPAQNPIAERAGPGWTASLSVLVPGAGQMLAGEPARGLFFASGMGFALSVLCALLATLDRLFPTLDLLELPRATVGVALAVLFIAAAALHVAAVVDAHSPRAGRRPADLHPLVALLASALVPGWGQILVGHRVRAAFFLGGVWLIAAAWLTATPAGLGILRDLGVEVSRGARDGWGPIALVTAPILAWALAIYDAAMGAAGRS